MNLKLVIEADPQTRSLRVSALGNDDAPMAFDKLIHYWMLEESMDVIRKVFDDARQSNIVLANRIPGNGDGA
jgi:hypothetical protein